MYTVMLVEDEMLVRTGLNVSVDWKSFDMLVVDTVSDGVSAWEAFKKTRHDVVLTDIRMPNMNGIELIQHIRMLKPDCQVVVISCIEDFKTLYAATNLNVAGYLLKSAMTGDDIDAVLWKVRRQLDNRPCVRHSEERIPESAQSSVLISALDGKFGATALPASLSALTPQSLLVVRLVAPSGNDVLRHTAAQLLAERLHLFGTSIVADNSGHIVAALLFDVSDIKAEIRHLLEDLDVYMQNVFDVGISAVISWMEDGGWSALPGIFERDIQIADVNYFRREAVYVNDGGDGVSSDLRKWIADLRVHPAITSQRDPVKRARVLKCISVMETSAPSSQEAFECAFRSLADMLFSPSQRALHADAEFAESIVASRNAFALFKCFDKLFPRKPSLDAITSGHEMERSIAYLETHYMHDIALNDVAAVANLSPSYFEQSFRKATGSNFSHYLADLRFDRACELLRSSELTIQEIAQKCGFSDASYFTRFFKQKTGKPPRQWRISQ